MHVWFIQFKSQYQYLTIIHQSGGDIFGVVGRVHTNLGTFLAVGQPSEELDTVEQVLLLVVIESSFDIL